MGNSHTRDVPPLVPIEFDAGRDWPLFEANGWDPTTDLASTRNLTIRRTVFEDRLCWVVASGEDSWLRRVKGGPIAFCIGDGEHCATPEEAVDLLREYLNQPINPYLWVREHAD